VLIRPAVVADSTGILDIYNHEVLTSVVTFDLVPRTEAEQRAWISHRSGAHAVVVAVDPEPGDPHDIAGHERIVGFGALSPYRERPGYSTTVEDSVYVHQDHRGEGVGALILDALISTATSHGFHALMAKIVDGHDASIGLHAAAGFEVVGKELQVGRKFNRFHDVVLMERLL
jgi:L-amino acid N-acyltransferase